MNKTLLFMAVAVALFVAVAGNGAEPAFNVDVIVANAAREALEYGRIDGVLVWIKNEYEEEVRAAFARAEEVRELTPAERVAAERFFIDTVLRVQHAGDGTVYAGIESGGQRLSPAVAMAAESVESGAVDRFGEKIADYAANGIHERYKALMEKKKHRNETLEAGRAYVREYLSFLRYVDAVFRSLEGESEPETSQGER